MDLTHPLPRRLSRDPLWLALLIAIAVHAFILLGIGFDVQRNNPPAPERTLDITLVTPKKPPPKVEKPDFLAQASQEGGGEKVNKNRPSNPLGNPAAMRKQQKPAPELVRAGAVRPEPVRQKRIVTARRSPHRETVRNPRPTVQTTPRPSAAQLLASTQREIDRLTAELDRHSQAASRHKRRKVLNASTQEYKYASYLEAWRKKVERIGNLNYPDEAKRRRLYGSLILHVAVRADGSIEQIRLLRSSGHKILDDAAIRIVRLSAPFAPFPPDIRKEVDVLDITRTWQFRSGNRLFSRP
ncbi:MAG TPA: energy transducer TonB [Gammaproteobacteria bacterium]|nr:energy transducer TonB [Gammaproteobacteria bacterium]